MQVSCGQCSARYEFDAAAIPAEGYDAQCTECGAVFFVAPEQTDGAGIVSVACNHCGARYEFPADQVPPEGYDAQCTNCQEVFFVSPGGAVAGGGVSAPAAAQEGDGTAFGVAAESAGDPTAGQGSGNATPNGSTSAATPALSSASAGMAMTSPEPSGEVPAGPPVGEQPDEVASPAPGEAAPAPLGSDPPPDGMAGTAPPSSVAQLAPDAGDSSSSASGVPPLEFAVEPLSQESEAPLAGGDAAPPDLGAPALDEAPTAPMTRESMFGGTPSASPASSSSAQTPSLAADPTSSGVPAGGGARYVAAGLDEDGGYSDLMALDAELGEPMAAPDGSTPEGDFERMLRNKRRRRIVVGGLLLTVCLYSVATYFVAPRVFDLTVGKLVGIKLTVDPAALPKMEEGLALLLKDTDEGYEGALRALDEALAIDPLFPEAICYSGLAHVLRGADIQAEGRREFDVGAEAAAEIEALNARERKGSDSKRRVDELTAVVEKAEKASTGFFEKGGKEVAAGAELLKKAFKDYDDRPLTAESAGIYYATDPDSLFKAAKLLRYSLQLRGVASGKMEPGTAPSAWAAYLKARLVTADDRERAAAAPWYEAAIRLEPKFMRARYDLAELLLGEGKFEAAEATLAALEGQGSAHPKSQLLAQRIAAAKQEQLQAQAKTDPGSSAPSSRVRSQGRHPARAKPARPSAGGGAGRRRRAR